MPRGYGLGEFYWFMENRKQASRTPNASRNTTSRSMSERQGVGATEPRGSVWSARSLLPLWLVPRQHALWNRQDWKAVLFQVQCQWAGAQAPSRAAQKLRCSLIAEGRIKNETRPYFGNHPWIGQPNFTAAGAGRHHLQTCRKAGTLLRLRQSSRAPSRFRSHPCKRSIGRVREPVPPVGSS